MLLHGYFVSQEGWFRKVDLKMKTIIQKEASGEGLGCCLTQDDVIPIDNAFHGITHG